jgi:hypothetical protein
MNSNFLQCARDHYPSEAAPADTLSFVHRLAVIKSCIAKKAFKNTETVPNSGVRVARVDRSTPMVAALVLVKDIDPRDRTRGDGVHRWWVGGTWGSEIWLKRQLLQSLTTAPLPIKPRYVNAKGDPSFPRCKQKHHTRQDQWNHRLQNSTFNNKTIEKGVSWVKKL